MFYPEHDSWMMFYKEKKNSKEEFGAFFVENYPKVKRFSQLILMSEQDAEDVAQDIFLKLMDRPDVWHDREKRDNYLFKMAKNHIFNFIKHKKVEREYQHNLEKENAIAEEFGIDDKLHAKEIELIIRYTIEQMPERRKEIFIMSRIEGKSNAQISELLTMSIRTVERHLYLALADLKKTLLFHIPD